MIINETLILNFSRVVCCFSVVTKAKREQHEKKEGVGACSVLRLKGVWLISLVITSYALSKIKSVWLYFFLRVLLVRSCQILTMKMAELGQKTENKICYMCEYLKMYIMLIKDILL